MSTEPVDSPGATVRRVGWLELFFDLAFVAFITQLAHGLHGSPQPADFLAFVAWSVPAWWAWTNIMVAVNLLPTLPPRALGVALLIAMAFVGVMAASVTEDATRAWSFSLACAGLRLVLLAIWVYRALRKRRGVLASIAYNGPTALIWIASAFAPRPGNFALWALAILIEIVVLRVGNRTPAASLAVDVAHAGERLGLFMIILMGESILSIVTAVALHWNARAGLTALVGFVAIGAMAWGFFVYGTDAMETGLARLSAVRDVAGLLDTVMILPYLLVIAVTIFAAGLATAVAKPSTPLSAGAALCLGGGIALFYLANGIVSRRWGVTWRRLLPWAIPGVVLTAVIVLVSGLLGATVTLACLTIVVLGITIDSIINERRRERVGV